ncbi:MAG: stage III sporulation protein AF [Bacillota bacterium]|nr:stage III sporulation protein AF [Bacillota bacterium]
MIEAIGSLVRYIVILIFLATLLEMLLPQGVFRRFLRMFVGILLIFTLLTPLQSIMRIAPYWEVPVITEIQSTEELGLILQRGDDLYRKNMKSAMDDYHSRIFKMLESELAREFSLKLVELEMAVEENPDSSGFGALESIFAVTRDLDNPVQQTKSGGRVEEIRISVGVKEEAEITSEEIQQDNSAEIRRYLAAYFQLPSDKVSVKMLP